jgi:hypothetical protein
VADGWCWFYLREKYCWLVAGGWFVLREKYCWMVADKPNEQGAGPMASSQPGPAAKQPVRSGGLDRQPRAAPRQANQHMHRREQNQYKCKKVYLVFRYKGNN